MDERTGKIIKQQIATTRKSNYYWLLNDDIDSIDLSVALGQVSAQRAAYALRYRQAHDQRLSLAVYLLLQQALRSEYGIQEAPEFVFGPHGKPELKDYPDIHFNLSHCSRAALCVVSSQPVGCDVETVPSELDMDVCRYCFNEEETAYITASDCPTLAFTELWTRKEAFLKWSGQGLTPDLPSLFCTHLANEVPFQTYCAKDLSYVYSICGNSSNQSCRHEVLGGCKHPS